MTDDQRKMLEGDAEYMAQVARKAREEGDEDLYDAAHRSLNKTLDRLEGKYE
ncbi:hypothetical protein [Streptomyces abikoensis]|uniref:Uncharacterized protein n=1 Tax=Streptomyces abikoensis TaxID=97398 RepID=A0ABW7TC53_9ACTN